MITSSIKEHQLNTNQLRHQLGMSHWLQGENRNLHKISWEKKSNFSWWQISGSFRRTSRHCAKFCLQLGVIWVSAMEDPNMAELGSWNVLLSYPAMRYPARRKGDRLHVQGVGTSPPWWHGARIAIRRNSIWIPQEDMRRHAIRNNSLREKHTTLVNITLRAIAYPIQICCPDGKHWLSERALLPHSKSLPQPTFRRSPMVCPDALSGHLLPWIPKNSPQSLIALMIKKLSKHQNLT